MYSCPAAHPRHLMMPNLRCCTCHGCRPSAITHRNPLSKTPPAILVSVLSFPDVCERSTLLVLELLRASKAISGLHLCWFLGIPFTSCVHTARKSSPTQTFCSDLFLILKPILSYVYVCTCMSSSSVPP